MRINRWIVAALLAAASVAVPVAAFGVARADVVARVVGA